MTGAGEKEACNCTALTSHRSNTQSPYQCAIRTMQESLENMFSSLSLGRSASRGSSQQHGEPHTPYAPYTGNTYTVYGRTVTSPPPPPPAPAPAPRYTYTAYPSPSTSAERVDHYTTTAASTATHAASFSAWPPPPPVIPVRSATKAFTFNNVPLSMATSAIPLVSHAHGRQRRAERGIDKRELQVRGGAGSVVLQQPPSWRQARWILVSFYHQQRQPVLVSC